MIEGDWPYTAYNKTYIYYYYFLLNAKLQMHHQKTKPRGMLTKTYNNKLSVLVK